jgi:hypothetical protein
MLETIFSRVKGFILDPVGTYRASRDDPAKIVFSCFGALLVFYAIMSAVITALSFTAMSMLGLFGEVMPFGSGFAAAMLVLIFVMVLIAGTIFTLVAGAWIHLWVYLFGGRNGIMQTMKITVYGMTPSLAFGWIPGIGILFVAWSFILDILGLRELAGLNTNKAALAMIIAVAIPLIVLIYLFVVFFIPYMSASAHMASRAGY